MFKEGSHALGYAFGVIALIEDLNGAAGKTDIRREPQCNGKSIDHQ
jgi:hypothetical protein